MNFIAMDLGSTFIKAIVYDLDAGSVLFTKKCHTPEKIPSDDPHYFEVDIGAIEMIVKDIIAECATRTDRLGGILFSTQQHGCVLRYPGRKDVYISWQDTRCLETNPETGISYLAELEKLLPPKVMKQTGVPVKPALALCNLYALFKREQLAKNPHTRLSTLGSYIIERLTGNDICHITNAAPLGFVNVLEKSWDHEILTRAGMDFLNLPRITAELSRCGTYRLGDLELPVYPDLGDVQTSVYGTAARSGDMIINIATSGQLVMIRDDYKPGNYEIRPYYDNNYCYVISRMPGGRNFDVLIDFFRSVGTKLFGVELPRDEIWNRVQRLNLPETSPLMADCGVYELPDRLADGRIGHIDHANFTLENVIAAFAADYGQQYRRFADILTAGEEFTGRLCFIGGAVLRNPFLRRAIARQMGIAETVDAPQDEVYGGMFKLARRCVSADEI